MGQGPCHVRDSDEYHHSRRGHRRQQKRQQVFASPSPGISGEFQCRGTECRQGLPEQEEFQYRGSIGCEPSICRSRWTRGSAIQSGNAASRGRRPSATTMTIGRNSWSTTTCVPTPESTMQMLKSKFGPSIRSRTQTGQINELLTRCLCHKHMCAGPQYVRVRNQGRFSALRPQSRGPVLAKRTSDWRESSRSHRAHRDSSYIGG